MNNTKYEPVRIKSSGMGGAFNPPNHPEHSYSIETDLKCKPENRGSMSLTYALTRDYISPQIKIRINNLLAEWDKNKLPITSPECLNWIQQVLSYFGHTKGIEFIKKYYPDYK